MNRELERALNCIDRGQVSEFSTDGRRTWIECCARCHAVAHLVILHENNARVRACPRCLVVLDGEYFMGPQVPPRDVFDWKKMVDKAKHINNRNNRIKRYMGDL
jgi:hypothetical protein